MAITDELIIKIRVKSKDATKNIHDTKKAVEDLGAAKKKIDQDTKGASDAVEASSGVISSSLKDIAVGAAQIFAGWKATELVVSGVKASLEAFMQFETAIVGLGKTTDISGQELEDLGNSFQQLSERIPVSATELANIGQAAGALGVRGSENILNFTETIAKLASATNLGSEEAAMSLKRILDVTNESIDNVDEFASVLVALGNNFATTERDIAATATELGKAIGIFGATSAQVAGISAAMAALGIQAALGSSSVGKSFREIDAAVRGGGERLEQLQKITGQTGDQLRKTFETDPVRVFQSFLAGLGRIQQQGGSVSKALEKMNLSGDEINKTLPIMASRFDLVTRAVNMANSEFQNATALNTEASKAFATTASKFKMMQNAIGNLAADFGQLLAPAFNKIIDLTTEFIQLLRSGVEWLNIFSNKISLGFKVQDLTSEIKKVTDERNKLFQAIETTKNFEPNDSSVKKFIKLYRVFGDTKKATEALNIGQKELEAKFRTASEEVKILTDATAKSRNQLYGFKDVVTQTKNQLDALGGKRSAPKIKTEIDDAAMKKAKQQVDEMAKYEGQIVQMRGQQKAYGDDQITQMRTKLSYDIEQLDLLIKKVQQDEKLTAAQKEQVIAKIEQLKQDKKTIEFLDEQFYANDVLKRLMEDKVALAQRYADIGASEETQLKNKYLAEKRVLNVRQEELKKYQDIHAASIAVVESMKELMDIMYKEELFEIRIKILPEFGQDVARATKSFMEQANFAIIGFNDLFETFIPQIPQGIRNNLALAVGDFTSSIEGMFRQGAGLFGKGLGYIFDGFGKDVKNLGDVLESNFGLPVKDITDSLSGMYDFAKSIPGDLVKMFGPEETGPKFPKPTFIESDLGPNPPKTWIDDLTVAAVMFKRQLESAFDWGVEQLKTAWSALETVFDFWGKVTDKVFKKFPSVEGFAKSLGPLFSGLGTVMGKAAGYISDVAMKLFDADFIQGLADQLSNFVEKLPDALIKAFRSLITAITKVIDRLPEIATKLMDALNVLLQKVLDKAPELIMKVLEAFNTIVDRLPDLFGRIFDALPGVLNTFLSRLPDTIEKIFKSLGTIIAQFIKAFPEIFKSIVDNIPDIVKAFIIGLIDSIGMVVEAFVDYWINGGAEKVVGAFLRMIPKLVVAIVNGVVNGLKRGLGRIFNGFKVPDALGKLPENLSNGLKKLGESATQEAGQIFRVLDMKAIARGEDAAGNIKAAIADANKRLGERFGGLLRGLVDAWRWIYDNTMKPFIDLTFAAWRFIYDNVLQPIIGLFEKIIAWFGEFITFLVNFVKDMAAAIWEAIQGIFDMIGQIFEGIRTAVTDAFNWVKENVVKPLTEAGQKAFTWVKENIIDKLVGIGEQAFSWVKDNIIDKLTGIGQKAFTWVKDNIVDKMGEIGKKIADPISKAFGSATEIFKSIGETFKSIFKLDFSGVSKAIGDAFSTAGEAMKEVFRAILNPFIDIINGIIGAINGLVIPEIGWNIKAGRLGSWSGTLIGETDLIPGEIAPIAKFAKGGLVSALGQVASGFGTDTVPAMLTPGEFVVKREAVQSLGVGTMNALNSGQLPTAETTINNYDINVAVSFDGMPDENFVKTKIIPAIKSEMKKASLKGELLVSKRGIF